MHCVINRINLAADFSCHGSGHTPGEECCVGTDCTSLDGSCRCDFLCQFEGNCCEDYEKLQCTRKYYVVGYKFHGSRHI